MPSFSRFDAAYTEPGNTSSTPESALALPPHRGMDFDAVLLNEMDTVFPEPPMWPVPLAHGVEFGVPSAEHAFVPQPDLLSENTWSAFDADANLPAVPLLAMNAEEALLQQSHEEWHNSADHVSFLHDLSTEDSAVVQAKRNHSALQALWDHIHYRSLEDDLLPLPPLPDDALLQSDPESVLAVQERSKEALLAKRAHIDAAFALPDIPLVNAVLDKNNTTIITQGQHLAQLRGQNWAGQSTASDIEQGWFNPYQGSVAATFDGLSQSNRSVQSYIDDQIAVIQAQNLDIEERVRFLDTLPKHERATIRTLDFPGRHSRARYNRPLMQDGRPVVFVYYDALAQEKRLVDLRVKPDAQHDDAAFHALIGGGKAAYTSAISSKVSKDKKRKQAENNAGFAAEHKEKKRAENNAYLRRVEASADRLTRHRQSRQEAQVRYRDNVRAQRDLHKELESVRYNRYE